MQQYTPRAIQLFTIFVPQDRQLYYLLSAPSGYYWLYATVVENVELGALLPLTHPLIRRALQALTAVTERENDDDRP